MADTLIPRHNKLYRCRYGFNGGSQVCLFAGYRGDGYVVRKWRANSGRWTAPTVIAKTDLLDRATAVDCRQVAVDVSKL